jgi:hypothetical protein
MDFLEDVEPFDFEPTTDPPFNADDVAMDEVFGKAETFGDLEYEAQCAIAEWGGDWVNKLLDRGWNSDAILGLVRKYPKGIGRAYLGHSDDYILEDIARIGRKGEPAPVETGLDTFMFPVTHFQNQQAATQRCEMITLPALAKEIEQSTGPNKAGLPWLKLGVFGNLKSDKGCLRTNRNMIEVSGVEGDHDSGELLFEEAVRIMRAANIRAMFYTSASFIPGEREKWRVLVPLSKRYGTAARYDFVAKLNGLLSGHLADESYTMSLSYYYGSIDNNPDHRVVVVDGRFLDEVDGLDHEAIGRGGKLERDKPKQENVVGSSKNNDLS